MATLMPKALKKQPSCTTYRTQLRLSERPLFVQAQIRIAYLYWSANPKPNLETMIELTAALDWSMVANIFGNSTLQKQFCMESDL